MTLEGSCDQLALNLFDYDPQSTVTNQLAVRPVQQVKAQTVDSSEDWSSDVPEYVFKAYLRVDPEKQLTIEVGVLFIMFMKILDIIFAYRRSNVCYAYIQTIVAL
jgi:hypothetical protein